MVVIKNGVNFQAKIVYSNRFDDLVEITGGYLGDRIATFPLTQKSEEAFEAASTSDEVDATILALYEGKKGRRS